MVDKPPVTDVVLKGTSQDDAWLVFLDYQKRGHKELGEDERRVILGWPQRNGRRYLDIAVCFNFKTYSERDQIFKSYQIGREIKNILDRGYDGVTNLELFKFHYMYRCCINLLNTRFYQVNELLT